MKKTAEKTSSSLDGYQHMIRAYRLFKLFFAVLFYYYYAEYLFFPPPFVISIYS